jgi:hypothetical protein
MKRFERLKPRSPRKCLRAVGITFDQCLTVRDQILACIQAEQAAHPLKKRGQKAVTVTVEDKLLVTVTALRPYPTFAQLGDQFGLWESSAHKRYHQDLDRLVKVCQVPGRNALLDADIGAIIVEVTEPRMERPKRQQGAWYSGKKTIPHQSPGDRLAVPSPDSRRRGWQRPYP